MSLNELITTIKDNTWLIVIAVIAIILLIIGIRKYRANKQVEKNNKLADEIKKEKEKKHKK